MTHILAWIGAGNRAGMVLPAAIILVTYGAIMSERVNRAVAALLGAGLTVASGLLTQDQAIAAIDWNTLALLAGTMIIVGVAKKSGLFGYVAIRAAQAVKAHPGAILAALALVTAAFSALLNNVTTVLLIVPVTFVICGELKVPVYPFLFAEIFASNIGGTATLIGDPPNILIGSAVRLSFDDFVLNLAPVVLAVFAVQTLLMHLIWGAHMKAAPDERARVMAMHPRDFIGDPRLLRWSVLVIVLVIAAFVFARQIRMEPGSIAMLGAAVLMFLDNLPRHRHRHAEAVSAAFHEVEWIAIFFFIGLFVVIGGVKQAGILDLLARQLLASTGGNLKLTAEGVLWASALLSAIVDNIPFVATMIPMVKSMAPALGGEHAILPLWWALSLGACLGGNGTLIGASANLTVAGIAEKSGVRFSFFTFTALALPLMLIDVAIAHAYVVWRYF